MLFLGVEHREKLSEPFGPVYSSTEDVLPLISKHLIFCVGDVVTGGLLKHGCFPDIAIIDGQTMRRPCNACKDLDLPDYNRIDVVNPPGYIAEELETAIFQALAETINGIKTVIQIKGEEDLAVLPLIIQAPDNCMILYGQPNRGIVLLKNDKKLKDKATLLLSLFCKY